MAATLDMPSLGKFYRRQLLEDVLPFWFPRAYDEKNGGLYHCFDADGTLVDSDKSVWAQGRMAWDAADNVQQHRKEYGLAQMGGKRLGIPENQVR